MYPKEDYPIHTFGIHWPDSQQPDSSRNNTCSSDCKPVTFQNQSPAQIGLDGPSGLSVDGKAIQLGKLLQKRTQTQDIQKVTLYLPKSLCSTLNLLKRQQLIDSYSQTVKEALIQYLTK